jgi:hypothetical protein
MEEGIMDLVPKGEGEELTNLMGEVVLKMEVLLLCIIFSLFQKSYFNNSLNEFIIIRSNKKE